MHSDASFRLWTFWRWWKVVGVTSSSLAEVSISSNKKTKQKIKKTYYRAKQHI